MPLYHCKKCHHEWEGDKKICDWCGGTSYVLEKETAFERFCKWITENEKQCPDCRSCFRTDEPCCPTCGYQPGDEIEN